MTAIRRTYIFAPHAPPFPDFAEVEEALDPQVRTINNLERMRDALQLSNLATWVYTIIAPDQAGDLLRDLDTGADDPFQVRSRGKGVGSDQVIDRVRRRNEILVMAWKNFWSVVVPVEKRDSESALTVWLDFATFVSLDGARADTDHSQLAKAYSGAFSRTIGRSPTHRSCPV